MINAFFNYDRANYKELENRLNRINWYQLTEDKGAEGHGICLLKSYRTLEIIIFLK